MSLRVLLFILLIPLVFGEFQVKVTQSLYEAQENASVTMEWTFPPGADLSQVHVICEQSIANTSRNMFVQFNGVEDRQLQDKHFGGRVRVDTDAQRRGLLQVHLWNLSREDSGRYSCDIMISASGNAADCVLNVTSAPEPLRATETPLIRDRTGLYIGLGLFALVLVGGVVFCAALKKKNKPKSDQNSKSKESV